MIFLDSNVPKYDDSHDDEQEGDDDRVKSNDTDKNRAKDLAGVPPFDPERANRNSLIFLSLLLLVAMPIVLWRYFSQPLVVVWRLSFLLCCCCAIWAALLAVTLPTETMLLRLGFVFMLALYIDCALDPKIAVLVPYLNSHFAVGMLGYALAERRQHDGVEVSAATVGVPSGEKEADRLFCAQFLGGAYLAVITAGYAAAVAYWVVLRAADFSVENLVMTVFLPLSGVLVLWITFVGAMLLRGALIGEIGFSALITYLVVMTMLCVMFAMTMGDTWAMVLGWPLMLALSGVFGYCICIYATFNLRMRLGLGLPPVKPDESKEDSMRILLEKQGHGGDDLHPGNNVVDCSFSPEVAGVKSKIA